MSNTGFYLSFTPHVLHFITMFMSGFVHSVTGSKESEGYEPSGLQLIPGFRNLRSGIRRRWPDFCCLVGPNEICSHRANQQSPEIKQNTGKWMFSNQLLFHCIGTSNWSENYFTDTAGVGLIIKQNSTSPQRRQQPVQEQLKGLFERDWNSKYAVNLEDVQGQKDCNWRGRLWSELRCTFKIETKKCIWILFPCKSRNSLLFVFVREITFSWCPHWWHENFW